MLGLWLGVRGLMAGVPGVVLASAAPAALHGLLVIGLLLEIAGRW